MRSVPDGPDGREREVDDRLPLDRRGGGCRRDLFGRRIHEACHEEADEHARYDHAAHEDPDSRSHVCLYLFMYAAMAEATPSKELPRGTSRGDGHCAEPARSARPATPREAMNPGTSSPLNRLPVRSEGDMIAVL